MLECDAKSKGNLELHSQGLLSIFSLAACERVAAPMLVPLGLLRDLRTPLGHCVLSGDLGGQAALPGTGTVCCRRGLLERCPFAELRWGLDMPGDTGMEGPAASESALGSSIACKVSRPAAPQPGLGQAGGSGTETLVHVVRCLPGPVTMAKVVQRTGGNGEPCPSQPSKEMPCRHHSH